MSIFNNFPAVGAGGDTSDATATAADILRGKTAYGADGKITGTIPSVKGGQIVPNASGLIAVAGNVYTTGARIIPKEDNFIPANIRKDVSIWGVVGTLDPGSTPVPDPNLIPANVKAGVTIDGVTGTFTNDANATAESMQLGVSAYVNGTRVVGTAPIQEAKTVTPTTTEQTAVARGSFTSGAVKVAGDANLVAENIKEGVSIFGVTGTLAGGGGGGGVTTYSHLDTWQQINMGNTLTVTMDHQPTVIVFYVSNAMITTSQSTASSVTLNTTGNFVATSRADNGPSIPRPTITSTGFTYSYGSGANCWIKYVAY